MLAAAAATSACHVSACPKRNPPSLAVSSRPALFAAPAPLSAATPPRRHADGAMSGGSTLCLLKRLSLVCGGAGRHARSAAPPLSAARAPGGSPMGKQGPKFYAVRVGAQPGVYRSWAECERQVRGYRGASHKSFGTQAEAEAFISGAAAAQASAPRGLPAAAGASARKRGRSRSRSPVAGAASSARRRMHSAETTRADEDATADAAASPPLALATDTFLLQFDGGSRGNPGPAGGGAVLLAAHGGRVAEAGVWLGHATNNVAEYTGLLAGLQLALRCGVRRLLVEGDSTLVTRQMRGEFRCEAPGLQALHRDAAAAARSFDAVEFRYIPRERNARADALANRAMDNRESFDRVHAALGAARDAAAGAATADVKRESFE